MLALLPMFGTIIGVIVLHQVPTVRDVIGIGLVAGGVALHQVRRSTACTTHHEEETCDTCAWARRA